MQRPLTKKKERVNYGGHTENWYSQKKLSETGWKIPGRYVNESDGTVKDGEGFIYVSSDDYPKGTEVDTSLGRGKVYDNG